MPFYKVDWMPRLEETDVRKDQLVKVLEQKEAEIKRLQATESRLLKLIEELEKMNEDLESAHDTKWEESDALRERDRLATEIIQLMDMGSVARNDFPRSLKNIYDLITNWEQAGMALAQ